MRREEKIALERIRRLLELSASVHEQDPALAKRYVELAWRLKTRYTLRLTAELKRRFCRKCLSIWIPGKNVRVRIRRGVVTWTCLGCGKVYRMPTKEDK